MKPIYLTSGAGMFLILFLFFPDARAQDSQKVTGVVTDSLSRSPLPGVSVVEQGTSNGTSTDLEGNFSLTVTSEDAVLEFSFLGYKTSRIAVPGDTSQLNVLLAPASEALEQEAE